MSVKISGDLNGLMRAVSVAKAKAVEQAVDIEVRKMTQELSGNTAADAPVKTGALKKSIEEGVHKNGHLAYELRLDLDNVPYIWRQNFEHQTKRYFITRNFNEIESQFGRRIQDVVNKTW